MEILKKASDNVHILRNINPVLDTRLAGVRNTASLTLSTFVQHYSWFYVDLFNTNDHEIKWSLHKYGQTQL